MQALWLLVIGFFNFRFHARKLPISRAKPSSWGSAVAYNDPGIQKWRKRSNAGRRPLVLIQPGRYVLLIVQAEDDEGNVIEMAKVVRHLGLDDQQLELVRENTHIEFVNDLRGAEVKPSPSLPPRCAHSNAPFLADAAQPPNAPFPPNVPFLLADAARPPRAHQ